MAIIHRPHIHIICNSKDVRLHPILDAITVCFDADFRLTKDLFIVGADYVSYSWRCINESDWVFILFGQSYGEASASGGGSQFHISCLNAKTKNKPIIAFVTDEQDRPRQLTELMSQVSASAKDIYHLDAKTNLKHLFGQIKTTINNQINPQKDTTVKTNTALGPASLAHYSSIDALSSPKKTTPSLQDEVLLNCTAHAFRGGTLIETTFLATTTWHDILLALDSNLAFTSQGLWRILNDLITPQAMPAIKMVDTAVHAISRCQVVKADLLWVEEELHTFGWISQVGNGVKPTWRMSDTAKRALNL